MDQKFPRMQINFPKIRKSELPFRRPEGNMCAEPLCGQHFPDSEADWLERHNPANPMGNSVPRRDFARSVRPVCPKPDKTAMKTTLISLALLTLSGASASTEAKQASAPLAAPSATPATADASGLQRLFFSAEERRRIDERRWGDSVASSAPQDDIIASPPAAKRKKPPVARGYIQRDGRIIHRWQP